MEFSLSQPRTVVKTPKEYAQQIHDFDIDTTTHAELTALFKDILEFVDVAGVKSRSPLSHIRQVWVDDTPSKRHWQVFYYAYQTLLALHHSLDAEERECGLKPRSTQWFQIRAELHNVFAVCIDSFQRYVTAIENENTV